MVKKMFLPTRSPWVSEQFYKPRNSPCWLGANPRPPFFVRPSKVLRLTLFRPVSCSAIPNCRCYIDEAAAGELTRFRFPWKVGPVDWTPELIRKAVVSLASDLKKPVLRLRDEDYAENGLAALLLETGSAYSLNIRIFNELQHTITGWPGGKPNADDSNRPVPADPAQKRVLVFGPEPLDAELGMAGTLHRLRRHQHEVTFAYLTSGNLGVPDNEARMAISLLNELSVDRPAEAHGKDRLRPTLGGTRGKGPI